MFVFSSPVKERMDSCFRRNDGGATHKWIPAYAGMTEHYRNGGIYRMSWFDWIPAFAGMTRIVSSTPEKERRCADLPLNVEVCLLHAREGTEILKKKNGAG